jgi:hypothetical protein
LDPEKAIIFNGWASSDKSAILAFDAPLSGQALDSKRYQRVATYQMRGPDRAGDPIPFGTFQTSYNTARDGIFGTGVNSTSTYLAGFDVPIFGGVRAGFTFGYAYTDTRTSTTGEQKLASLTLRTPTPCLVMDVHVYLDAAFGTYFATPAVTRACTDPVWASGKLLDGVGQPVANQVVPVSTSTGDVGVYSGADGVYKLYGQ